MRIRRAELTDDRRVLQIAEECHLVVDPERERGLGHSQLWVGEESGEGVIAFAVFWILVPEAEIIDIGVATSARRRGCASRILKAFLAQEEARGVTELHLEVRESNAAARALYESLGFEQNGRRAAYYPDGQDAILYRYCTTGQA